MTKAARSSSSVYFDDFQAADNLKRRALRGGAIAVTARGLATVIQIGGTMVLGRLLTPEDFGLVAMVTAVTSIFYLFQDVGLTDATIQTSTINHQQVSTLFWINWAICLLITLLLIALAPAVAWFYKTSQLLKITMVSSVSFIFWGLTFQHMALLKRKMLFLKVSTITILAQLLSTGASIIFALSGFRYWAIVLRDVLASVITFLLTWALCRWRPALPGKISEVKSMLQFGANSAGTYIVSYFARNLDKILMGRKFGSTELGFYSRAYYLATTPAGQISDSLFHVSVSTLSKIRDDVVKYRRYYLNALSIVSFVGMPLSAFLVLMSKELIRILLGPQWDRAAEMFSVLGLASGLYILYYTNSWLHVSLGRSDRWLKWGIFSSTLLGTAFAIGMFFGAKGIAWGYTVTIILMTFPAILYAGKPVGLRAGQVLSRVWRSTFAAIGAAVLFHFIKDLQVFQTPLVVTVALSFVIFIGLFLGIFIILNRGIRPLKEMYSFLRIVVSRKT